MEAGGGGSGRAKRGESSREGARRGSNINKKKSEWETSDDEWDEDGEEDDEDSSEEVRLRCILQRWIYLRGTAVCWSSNLTDLSALLPGRVVAWLCAVHCSCRTTGTSWHAPFVLRRRGGEQLNAPLRPGRPSDPGLV